MKTMMMKHIIIIQKFQHTKKVMMKLLIMILLIIILIVIFFLLNQEEIPFVNLWSSFSKIFIKSVLRSTKRYNTYEKEIRKNCLISLLAVIATSIIYLIIALYTYVMDGYSQRNIHDIDSYAERTMVFSSLFLIFASCLGLIGVRFKFKPMIVLYILMNIISFSFQCYSVKQIHNAVIHVERNMAFAWWDVYTVDVIKSIQNENNCCGYLDYTDYAVPMDEICPEKLVHKKVKFETIGPIPVRVKKNRFNKTFSIPDVGDLNQYFTKEEMKQFQVKIKDPKPKSNKNSTINDGTAIKDIGIDLDLKDESKENTNKDLKRRKNSIDSLPVGCYKFITSKVAGSLSLLCIFCWILSISSPFALLFSLLYCKNLDMKKKSCEYF